MIRRLLDNMKEPSLYFNNLLKTRPREPV